MKVPQKGELFQWPTSIIRNIHTLLLWTYQFPALVAFVCVTEVFSTNFCCQQKSLNPVNSPVYKRLESFEHLCLVSTYLPFRSLGSLTNQETLLFLPLNYVFLSHPLRWLWQLCSKVDENIINWKIAYSTLRMTHLTFHMLEVSSGWELSQLF